MYLPDEARPATAYHAYTLPGADRLAVRAAFLVDASTLNLGEAIAAMARENGLATLVGEPTAGTVGEVDSLGLPGGIRFTWTGTDARTADGARVEALRPDLPAGPTLAGLREGHDEVLGRAVAALTEAANRTSNQN